MDKATLCARVMARLRPGLKAVLTGLETAVEEALHTGLQEGLDGAGQEASAAAPAPCLHRAAHRPGRPARIDSAPELRAFILARLDTMTFPQIADDVARHFPPARRVGKSAIHKWWQRNTANSHPS